MPFSKAATDTNSESTCTSDDSENEETKSTSNESAVSNSSASISNISFQLAISLPSASVSPEFNTTIWDEHVIDCDIDEMKGWLDQVKACSSRIETRIDRISSRESADFLKCQEMRNVMTLIDVIYDLTECTKRSVNLIVEQRKNR